MGIDLVAVGKDFGAPGRRLVRALDGLDLTIDEALPGVRVRAEVKTTGRTGVEMEALTAVSVACLTVYDMVKAVDKAMTIDGIRLLSKTGGKSGDWHRPAHAVDDEPTPATA